MFNCSPEVRVRAFPGTQAGHRYGDGSDDEQDVSLVDVLQGEGGDGEVVAESVSVPDVENIVILATEHQQQHTEDVERSNKNSKVIKLKIK